MIMIKSTVLALALALVALSATAEWAPLPGYPNDTLESIEKELDACQTDEFYTQTCGDGCNNDSGQGWEGCIPTDYHKRIEVAWGRPKDQYGRYVTCPCWTPDCSAVYRSPSLSCCHGTTAAPAAACTTDAATTAATTTAAAATAAAVTTADAAQSTSCPYGFMGSTCTSDAMCKGDAACSAAGETSCKNGDCEKPSCPLRTCTSDSQCAGNTECAAAGEKICYAKSCSDKTAAEAKASCDLGCKLVNSESAECDDYSEGSCKDPTASGVVAIVLILIGCCCCCGCAAAAWFFMAQQNKDQQQGGIFPGAV